MTITIKFITTKKKDVKFLRKLKTRNKIINFCAKMGINEYQIEDSGIGVPKH